MPASDGDPCGPADFASTIENLPDSFRRDLAERHAEDSQRENRPATHGIDIGDGVGGGDAPEVARLVDHRGEEIDGRDQAGAVVDLPHGRIVAGLGPHQQLAERLRLAAIAEESRQNGR